jgi:hypothetical protein
MLKPIVEQENVDGLLLFDATTFGKAILGDTKCSTALQAMLHKFDFVARAASTTITAAQNSNALSFREKMFREPQDHWRLPGAAYSQITDANHLAAQMLLLQPTFLIEPGAYSNVPAIRK